VELLELELVELVLVDELVVVSVTVLELLEVEPLVEVVVELVHPGGRVVAVV
jgi:hypothetical protein